MDFEQLLVAIGALTCLRVGAHVAYWVFVHCVRRDTDLKHRYGGQPSDWAVVTGAGAGIGAACAERLCAEGFSVVVVSLARDRDAMLALQSAHGAHRVAIVECDAAEPSAAVAAVEARWAELRARAPQPRLRLLVNNVGVSTALPSAVETHSVAEVERIVSINLSFALLLTRALLPQLTEVRLPQCAGAAAEGQGQSPGARVDGSGHGRSGVLLVSSTAGTVPAPLASVYGATKAALVHFAASLVAEAQAANRALDVLCVTPSYVSCGNTPAWTGTEAARSGGGGGGGGGGGLASAIAGIASPRQIADGALGKLGCPGPLVVCSPWWVHSLQTSLLRTLLPRLLIGWVVSAVNSGSRARMLQQQQQQREASLRVE